jgi:hypothetical protein
MPLVVLAYHRRYTSPGSEGETLDIFHDYNRLT